MANDKLTSVQILLPVLLLSTAFAGFLGYQTSALKMEHDNLVQVYAQQNDPLTQVTKLKTQLSALATGTLTLAQKGDKDSQGIIATLKKAGVNVDNTPAPAAAAAPQTATPTTGKTVTP
ncbi:MAG: hypothetical protein WCD70_11080 [Alphaproteobacteria bacterium]